MSEIRHCDNDSGPMKIGTARWAKAFHDHLDLCQQCRDNPFGLCPVGFGILTAESSPLPASTTEENV